MTEHLNPVRWPAVAIEGAILIALGARHGGCIITADSRLAPSDPTATARINDAAARVRLTRSGPTPTLGRPIELSA